VSFNILSYSTHILVFLHEAAYLMAVKLNNV